MPGAHAKLSPSAAYIWSECPGMPTLAAGVHDESSEYAKRGTAAHSILERCLKLGFDADRFINELVNVADDDGQPADFIKFNRDDAEAVQEAVDHVRETWDLDADEIKLEARLTFSDDLWGTADVLIYRPATRELFVMDYKHGSGVPVDAIGNLQGVCYGVAAMRMLEARGLKVDVLRFTIIQPRCYHHLGPIRPWTIEAYDLPGLVERVELAVAEATLAADVADSKPRDQWEAVYLTAGDHCKWCKAAALCPAVKSKNLATIDADFSPVDPATSLPVPAVVPARPRYDPAHMASVFLELDRVEAWCKRVREFVYSEAERGVRFPGLKLVPKRPTRRIVDGAEPELVGMLELMGFPRERFYGEPELKSPAQIEAAIEPDMPGKTVKARKEAAKNMIRRWVSSQSSGHNIAPETDDRKAIRSDATDDFSPVT